MPHNVPRERIILFGLAALAVVALIFGAISSGISAGQQDAWMQGYTMGRLTAAAGVDGATVAPAGQVAPFVAPYAMGYTGARSRVPGLSVHSACHRRCFLRRAHDPDVALAPVCGHAGLAGRLAAGWTPARCPTGWPAGRLAAGPTAVDAGTLGLRPLGRSVGAAGGPAAAAAQPQQQQPAQPAQPPAQQPGQAPDQPAGER